MDNGETRNCVGILSDRVDRSGEVVGVTIARVVKALVVSRRPKGQRDDVRDAKRTRGVPWQQTSAETAGGEPVFAAYMASVRSTETVVEPGGDKARWFRGGRWKGTRDVWILRGLRGMPCGSVWRRGVETAWNGVHQSGHDARRRGPAKTACGRSDSRQQHRPQELR